MKRFFRTAFGKATLFIILNLCVILTVASVISAYAMFAEGIYFYKDKDEFFEYFCERRVESIAYSYTYGFFGGNENLSDPSGIIVLISDTDGNIVSATSGYDESVPGSGFKLVETFYHEDRYYNIDNALNGGVYDKTYYIKAYYSLEPIGEHEAFDPNFDFLEETLINLSFELRYAIYPIGLICTLAAIFIFIGLMCLAGHRPDTEEVFPGTFIGIPFDILLLAVGALLVLIIGLGVGVFVNPEQIIFLAVSSVAALNVFTGLCMSLATRAKLHRLFKELFIVRCFVWIGRLFRRIGRFFTMIPVVWRTVLIVTVFSMIELIVMFRAYGELDNLFTWWFVGKLLIVPTVIFASFSLRKLEKAGNAIAKGDLSYKTDVKGLYKGFRRHAENLNSISDAMAAAVDEKLRSERMKTELITNVSHDIKTPLTSIINYASLIGAEECDNAKISEYSGVLVRQSEKLKRLIEDLVEASKASTGNLEIEAEPCDASLIISQASGEFEDKITAAGLSLVTSEPNEEVRIMADTRRMWRVFDNLMNNACKYSQPGTRVYLSLVKVADTAVITLKNTSREPLNISSEELMERFVRGDSSRNTEGNGLGLSIAKSLTELQGGEFRIDVDGDLFKVTLLFSIIR